ncbi:MAG: hypothetical protein PHS44_07705 [Candidatus Dojkabacteria bacterium]|nr:hypothetical protein [Candidatus Dojkabacteria bacterium]
MARKKVNKAKKPNLVSVFSKFNKKYVIAGAFGGSLIFAVIGFFLLMYFVPIQTYSYNKDENVFSYLKFPLYKSIVKVYRNDELVKDEALRGSKGNVEVDFSEDGFYRIEYTVANRTKVEEFEIDRTPPEIKVDFTSLTKEEKSTIGVELNEEGTAYILYTITVTDENTGEKSEEERQVDIVDNSAEVDLREGENNFLVRASDEWKNESQKEILVVADYTDPKIELILPNYKETYAVTSEVKSKISDENGIEKVTINGNEVNKNEEGFYTLTISLENGDNGIEIIAWDKAGNEKIETSNVLKRVGSTDRINNIDNGSSNPALSGCSDTKTGYNVYCWINDIRADAGKGSIGWNANNANYSYWYAYCLHTTGFTGNPHSPTQAVIDCYNGKVGKYIKS